MNLLNKGEKEIDKIESNSMEERAFKIVNKYFNTNIYSYLDTSGSQSCNLYLNVVHFFNNRVNLPSVAA